MMHEGWSDGTPTVRTTAPTKASSSTNPSYDNLPVYDHALLSSGRDEALPVDPMWAADGWVDVWACYDHPS